MSSASPISPVAPARIGTLLVPVGNIGKAKFDSFVERLLPEDVIRLGDISPDNSGDKNLFSPLAFPNGVMLYNFITARPNDAHAGYAPYELFREALVVVGIVDGSQLSLGSSLLDPTAQAVETSEEDFFDCVERLMVEMRQEYSEAFLVQPLVFDFAVTTPKRPPYNIITIPTPANSKSTSIRTAMCDLSARVLAEMTALARSVASADFISSPMMAQTVSPLKELQNASRTDLRNGQTSERHSHDASDQSRPRLARSHLSQEERERRRASSPVSLAQQMPRRMERSISPAPIRTNSGLNSASNLDIRDRSNDRPPTSGTPRESSRDRRGVQSLIISATERSHNRSKARQGLVTGSLYLLAGRWPDALRELVDHATRAKVFGDLIWYAKGLENILATMILLGWARIDFTVPPICYTNPEKYASTTRHGRSSSFTRSSVSTEMNSEETNRSLTNLSVATPDLVHTVIDTLQKAKATGEDSLPQFGFAECVIRLTHLLAVLYRSDGTLNSRQLNYFVRGARLPSPSSGLKMRLTSNTGRELASLVFEAFPPGLFASTMPLEESVSILSGMVTVLSLAGLYRKRAMIIREALSVLIPRLIQARKVGAAEMGIHPAASLAAMHGLNAEGAPGMTAFGPADMEEGFHNLLILLCNTFGVVGESDMYKSLDLDLRHSRQDSRQDSRNAQPAAQNLPNAYLLQDNDRRHFGGQGLKLDVLRLSANFSEALPNFADTLHFTAALLKTTGPGNAPELGRLDHDMFLPPDEQARFASKIHRTLGSFTVADAARLETRYWDRFLVRDVELLLAEGEAALVPLPPAWLKSSNLDPSTPRPTGPFIFDPSKRESKAAPLNIFVAEERVDFTVTLQNLYDFEVTVQKFELITEGIAFLPTSHAFTLGPRRRQQVTASGIAHATGELFVTACRVKVEGCREEAFPVYRQSWNPTGDLKIKESGLAALKTSLQRPASLVTPATGSSQIPLPVRCSFRAISMQPTLSISSTTLSQSNLELFVGEIKTFSIKIRNESESVKLDFLRLSFVHTFSGSNRKAASQDQTEDSRPLSRHEPMRKQDTSEEGICIEPLAEVAINIEVLGVEGLRQTSIQFDYAYLGNEGEGDSQKSLYCRRSTLPIQVSVNPAIRLDRMTSIAAEEIHLASSITKPQSETRTLVMDFSNPGSAPMTLKIHAPDDQNVIADAGVIAAQREARIFVRCPDLEQFALTEEPTIALTAINTDLSLQEALKADARSRILDSLLSIFWKDSETGRHGKVDISPAYPILRTLSQDLLVVSLTLVPPAESDPSLMTRQKGRTYRNAVLESLEARATIRNRSPVAKIPYIRFHLTSARQTRSNEQDELSRSLAYSGVLHRPLAKLEPGASAEITLGLCALARGQFVVALTAEEVRPGLATRQWRQEMSKNPILGSAWCKLIATD